MSDRTEFVAIIHHVSSTVDDIVTAIEGIIATNDAPTITVPVDALTSVLSLLQTQRSITNKLVEENASIIDLVEKAVRNSK